MSAIPPVGHSCCCFYDLKRKDAKRNLKDIERDNKEFLRQMQDPKRVKDASEVYKFHMEEKKDEQ